MPSVIIDCPSCQRKLRVTDELVGKEVKCPTCRSMFQAPAGLSSAQATPAPQSTASGSLIQGAVPPSEASSERASPGNEVATCPSCGKIVPKEMDRCPHCEQALAQEQEEVPQEPRRRFRGRRDAEPHRGALVLTLGILSIVLGPFGLPLGIAALLLGRRDLQKIQLREMDPEGESTTRAGWVCGIIGTVLQSLSCVGCMLYVGVMIAWGMSMAKNMPRPPAPPRKPPSKKKIEAAWAPQELPDYLPVTWC